MISNCPLTHCELNTNGNCDSTNETQCDNVPYDFSGYSNFEDYYFFELRKEKKMNAVLKPSSIESDILETFRGHVLTPNETQNLKGFQSLFSNREKEEIQAKTEKHRLSVRRKAVNPQAVAWKTKLKRRLECYKM